MTPNSLHISGNYLLCLNNRVYKFKIKWCSESEVTKKEFHDVMHITEGIAKSGNLPRKITNGRLVIFTKISLWGAKAKAFSVRQFKEEKPGSLLPYKHSFVLFVFTTDELKENEQPSTENKNPSQCDPDRPSSSQQSESVHCDVNNSIFHEEIQSERINIENSDSEDRQMDSCDSASEASSCNSHLDIIGIPVSDDIIKLIALEMQMNNKEKGTVEQGDAFLHKQEGYLKETCEFNEASKVIEELIDDLCKTIKEDMDEAVPGVCNNKIDQQMHAKFTEMQCAADCGIIGSPEAVLQDSGTESETSKCLETKDSLNKYNNSSFSHYTVDKYLEVNADQNILCNRSGDHSSLTGHDNKSQKEHEEDTHSSEHIHDTPVLSSKISAERNKTKEEETHNVTECLTSVSSSCGSLDINVELLPSIRDLNLPKISEAKQKGKPSISGLHTSLCNINESATGEPPGYELSLMIRSFGVREQFEKEVLEGSNCVITNKEDSALRSSPDSKKEPEYSNHHKGSGGKLAVKRKRSSTDSTDESDTGCKKQSFIDVPPVILELKHFQELTPPANFYPRCIETFWNIVGDPEGHPKLTKFLSHRMISWLTCNSIINRLKVVFEEKQEEKITQINKYLVRHLRNNQANGIFMQNNPVVKCEPENHIASNLSDKMEYAEKTAQEVSLDDSFTDVEENMFGNTETVSCCDPSSSMQIENLRKVTSTVTQNNNSSDIEYITNSHSVLGQNQSLGQPADQATLQNSKNEMEAISSSHSSAAEVEGTKNPASKATLEMASKNTESVTCRLPSVDVMQEDAKTNKTLDLLEPETTDSTKLSKIGIPTRPEVNAEIGASSEESATNPERKPNHVVYIFSDADGCGVFTKASTEQGAVPKSYDFPAKSAKKYTIMYYDESSVPKISHSIGNRENSSKRMPQLLKNNVLPDNLQPVASSSKTETTNVTSTQDAFMKECLQLKLLEDCCSMSSILDLHKIILKQGIPERLAEQNSSSVSQQPTVPISSQNLVTPHFTYSQVDRWKSNNTCSLANEQKNDNVYSPAVQWESDDTYSLTEQQKRDDDAFSVVSDISDDERNDSDTCNVLVCSEPEEQDPTLNKNSCSVRIEVGVIFSSAKTQISLTSIISKDILRSQSSLLNCISETDLSETYRKQTSEKDLISLFLEHELFCLYQSKYSTAAPNPCQGTQFQEISTISGVDYVNNLLSTRVSDKSYSLGNTSISEEQVTPTFSHCMCPPSVKFKRLPYLFSVMQITSGNSNSRMKLCEMFEEIDVQEEQKSNFHCVQHCFYFQVDEKDSVEGFYATVKKYCSALSKFHNHNYSSTEFRRILLRDIWLPEQKHCLSFYTHLPMQKRKCAHCGQNATVELCLNCGNLFECDESGNYIPVKQYQNQVSSDTKPKIFGKSSAVLNLINDLQLCKPVVTVESLKRDYAFSFKNDKPDICKRKRNSN